MAKLGRPGMSDELRRELWRMWVSGSSISEIARAIGHPVGSIFTVVRQTGGYVPPATEAPSGDADAAGSGGDLPRPRAR